MYKKGELGKIQHLAASHPQDMDGWPDYWEQMIPMHYATHVVSPCLGLLERPGRVRVAASAPARCARTSRRSRATSSPSRSCHIKIKDSDVAAHIWRFLYDTARQYRESFDVYGTKKSFEWTLVEDEPHVMHTAKKPEPEIPSQVEVPDFAHLLPEPIRRFTQPQRFTTPSTCRSSKAAATAARTRTWSTSSSRRWSKIATRGPTPCSRPTGPASASAPTSRPMQGGRDRAAAGVYAGIGSPFAFWKERGEGRGKGERGGGKKATILCCLCFFLFNAWLGRYLPMCLPKGRLFAILRGMGTPEDINQCQRVEESLRASEGRFRAVRSLARLALFLTEPDGRVKAANPAACAMFGMTEDELCRPAARDRRPGTIRGWPRRWPSAPGTGYATNVELSFVRKNGSRFIGEVTSAIFPGETAESFVLVRDITAQPRRGTAPLRERRAFSGHVRDRFRRPVTGRNARRAIGTL